MALATTPPLLLVLRAGGLGDVLTIVPALRGLSRSFPYHQLAVATSHAWGSVITAAVPRSSVIPTSHLSSLSRVVRQAPDIAVNLHGRGPQSHRVLQELKPGRLVAYRHAGAGVPGPMWNDGEQEVQRWCRLVNEELGTDASPVDLGVDRLGSFTPRLWPSQPGPRVIVHPGAESAARRWPAGRFGEVAARLRTAGCVVLVTGTRSERLRCHVVASVGAVSNVCGKTTLAHMAGLVASADLVVCGDTGVAHLATALRTPSVVLFGPLSPSLWGSPDRRLHRALWTGDTSRPRPGDPSASHCDERLLALTGEAVLAECADVLRSTGVWPAPGSGPHRSRHR